MEKEKANTKPKSKHGWVFWVLIIILVAWIGSAIFDKSDEQSSCVNECVSTNQDCVSDNELCVSDSVVYDKAVPPNGWISEDDWQDCFGDLDTCSIELESCVSDCQE